MRLTLDAEVGAVLTELRADLEPRLDAHHGDLAAIGAWASKHPGRVARIAGLIHLLDAEERALPISGATMRAAVRIGDCLLAHACAVLLEPGRDRLERAARWAVQHASGFSLRDLYRGPCRAHGPVEDAEQLATLLEEHGYVRPLPTPAPSPAGGRPPSPRYEVNPGLLDALEPTGANARPATAPAATNSKAADDARAVRWLVAAVRRRALTDGEAAWRLDLLERLGPAAAMPAAWQDEA